VFQGSTLDGSKAIFLLYLNPLVAWVWIGGIVTGLGTLIALLPNRKSIPARPRPIRVKEAKEVETVS
jgi:cytochrome c-type biogenesis protein CcmF